MYGAQIRELRLALGISGKALARELGYAPQSVADVETAKGQVKLETEAKYLAAITELARRQGTERQRILTAELLELAAVD